MSELDRRLLLAGAGLAGVAALGRLAKAGPLDPPPGPVAPTGKTLTEVYNKIARTDAGMAEARIPVESLPMDENGTRTITQSGSYYLLGDLMPSVTNLIITANYVQLDLRGFRMPNAASSCISVSGNYVKIHNGTIEQASSQGFGIRTSTAITGLCLEDLIIRSSGTSIGRVGSSSSISRCVIRRCTFVGGGGDSAKITIGDYGLISECFVETGVIGIDAGHHTHVERCSVNSNGFSTGGAVGIRVGDFSLVDSCRASCDGNGGWCIRAGAKSLVIGCTASQLSVSGLSEAIGVGEGSMISRCVAQSGRTGVVLGDGATCQGTAISGGRYGALLAGDRCVIEDCVIRAIPVPTTVFPAVTLGSNCLMRRNTVSEVPDKVAISAVGHHNRIEENTISSCGTGIETIGTGNLVARNHCTVNTTDYSLAPGTKAGPIVSSPADPNGSHPWANFAT